LSHRNKRTQERRKGGPPQRGTEGKGEKARIIRSRSHETPLWKEDRKDRMKEPFGTNACTRKKDKRFLPNSRETTGKEEKGREILVI